MRKNVLRCLLVPALFCAAPARAQVPGVDCAGTLVAWSYSYPWYAENCYCASPNTYPVCPSGGTGGSDTSLPGQGGYYDFNRISPFGPASGESFFTLRYGDSFSDWQEEAMARWRSYLIRNRLAKAGIFVTPNNPAASLIEWFYKVFSSFNKTKEQPASLFATIDNSPVDKASSNFEANYVDPEFFLKDDPAIGPLAGNMAEVESNEQDIGGRCAPEGSIAPGFRMRYSSLFGGQYETVGLKIEQFPDGRAVFTDSADTRWTFRPYAGAATGYYRPPLGSPYRLARDKHSWRVETPDGDTIEFAPATQPDQWRPSRYNSADGSWLTYNYGPNGLARITDMHGRYFAFERNAQGLPLTITDQTGKKTTFTYDAQGHAIGVTYPDGYKKAFGYNSAGFMTSVKNGSLAGERYTYDSTGRVLTSESEGGVNRLEHFYNDVSSKTVITDAFANKTEYSYINEYGRKLATGEIGRAHV